MFTEVPAATRLPADRLEPFDSEMDDSQSEMNHGNKIFSADYTNCLMICYFQLITNRLWYPQIALVDGRWKILVIIRSIGSNHPEAAGATMTTHEGQRPPRADRHC